MRKVNICGLDTRKLPKLTNKQCNEYLVKAQNGDENARELLILSNIRLVLSIIQRFSNNKFSSDDLFQVGCVGLIKAINNFDTALNLRFSTYAVPMIIGEIRRFMREGSSLKVSRSLRDIAYKALQAKERISKETQTNPSIRRIAEDISYSEFEVCCALDAISDPVSLYEPVYNDGEDAILLMEQINDDNNNDDKWTEKVALRDALEDLPYREKAVIYLRYFLGKTQIEISEQIGISQAQVSRLEKNALEKIKKTF